MDINQINSAIMFGNWSNTELDSVANAIKFARAQMVKQNKRAITLGSTVRWTSQKNPQGMQGTVTKIARKYVTVKTGLTSWRVPANMLEVVS